MSSKQESNKTSSLYRMIRELNEYKRDREAILKDAITERLNESLKNYYDSVMRAYEKLEYKNEIRVLRKLNKM